MKKENPDKRPAPLQGRKKPTEAELLLDISKTIAAFET